jgi:hypothetical protein
MMDYDTYREKFFVTPAPEPKYEFSGLYGVTLFFQEYEQAIEFYESVLGPPVYVEGDSTKGWRIGETWLTLLRGRTGNPQNIEVALVMASPQEAERLQRAFIGAGGTGPAPTDELMYEPIRACPVTDPFGTEIMIYSRTETP